MQDVENSPISNDESTQEKKGYNPREKVEEFMSTVREDMTPEEIRSLPIETFQLVNAYVNRALNNPDKLGDALKTLVVENYHHTPEERFVYDPQNDGTLFVDEDGELVSIKNAKFGHMPVEGQVAKKQYIDSFDTYKVLTGPNKGKIFGSHERPLPEPSRSIRTQEEQ